MNRILKIGMDVHSYAGINNGNREDKTGGMGGDKS